MLSSYTPVIPEHQGVRLIITAKLQWHHLPKTAGTTTDLMFERSGLPLIWRDSQTSAAKHLPASEHPQASRLLSPERLNVVNLRRLPAWLISNLQHKQQVMGLELEAEPLHRGLFFRHRQQQWLPADWWLHRLGVTPQWELLRVESLQADFLALLTRAEPVEAGAVAAIRSAPVLNTNRYDKELSTWFTGPDLMAVYAANPLWRSLELQAYGSLVLEP